MRRCVKSRDNFVSKLLIGPVWFKDFYIRVGYKLQVIGEKSYQVLSTSEEEQGKIFEIRNQCKCKYPYFEHSRLSCDQNMVRN